MAFVCSIQDFLFGLLTVLCIVLCLDWYHHHILQLQCHLWYQVHMGVLCSLFLYHLQVPDWHENFLGNWSLIELWSVDVSNMYIWVLEILCVLCALQGTGQWHTQGKWIYSLSSKPFISAEKSLHGKGPKFAISPSFTPIIYYITATKHIYNLLEENNLFGRTDCYWKLCQSQGCPHKIHSWTETCILQHHPRRKESPTQPHERLHLNHSYYRQRSCLGHYRQSCILKNTWPYLVMRKCTVNAETRPSPFIPKC